MASAIRNIEKRLLGRAVISNAIKITNIKFLGREMLSVERKNVQNKTNLPQNESQSFPVTDYRIKSQLESKHICKTERANIALNNLSKAKESNNSKGINAYIVFKTFIFEGECADFVQMKIHQNLFDDKLSISIKNT